MNKKVTTITIGLLLIIITGVASAGFLDVYSIIRGAMQVEGPEFYLGDTNNEVLLVNEKSDDCSSPVNIDGKYRTFATEPFDPNLNFSYSPEVKLKVRAKAATTSSTASTVTPTLRVSFGYYENESAYDSSNPDSLCSETKELGDSFENHTFTANDCGSPEGVHRFYYEFEAETCATTCNYKIDKCSDGFYTGVKLED